MLHHRQIDMEFPAIPRLLEANRNTTTGFYVNWQYSTGSQKTYYHLQVTLATDTEYASAIVDDETISPVLLEKTIAELTDGTHYIYRLRIKYGTGSYSDWVSGSSYTVPVMRTITALAGSSPTVEGFTANWETLVEGDADSIDVQYASDVDFVNIIDTINVANTEISLAVHDLAQGTDYWYRIRSVVTIGIPTLGEWSNVIKKTTTAVAPAIPDTPEDITVEGAKLIWSKGTGDVDTWEVRLTVGEDVTVIDSITDLFLVIDGYSQGTEITYEFRGKKTVNGHIRYSAWSTADELTTSTVGLLTSPNTTDNLDDEFTANWTLPDPSNLDAITLQVSDNTSFTGATDHVLLATDITHTITGLTALQTWYWRVRGESLDQVSEWTSYQTVLIYPEISTAEDNSSAAQITKLDLHWLENVSGVLSDWHLQVALATDTAFANPVYDEEISGTLFAMLVTGLDPETDYIWRIRGVYYVDETPYYGSWDGVGNELTTEALPVVDDIYIDPGTYGVNWIKLNVIIISLDYCDSYRIQIATDSSFTNIIENTLATTSGITPPDLSIVYTSLAHLTPETVYYARIRGEYTAYGDVYGGTWHGYIEEDYSELVTYSLDSGVYSAARSIYAIQNLALDYGIKVGDARTTSIIQVATDSGFTNIIYSGEVGSPYLLGVLSPTIRANLYHRSKGVATHPNDPTIVDETDWTETLTISPCSTAVQTLLTAYAVIDTPAIDFQCAYRTLIDALIGYEIWSTRDALYLCASHDRQCSLINAKTPGTYNGIAIAGGLPTTFTQKQGWTGETTKGIDTQFNPATANGNFTKDANSFSVYIRSATLNSNSCVMGCSETDQKVYLAPRRTSEQILAVDNNNSLLTYTQEATPGVGLLTVVREAHNVLKLYKNGQQIGTTNTDETVNLPNLSIYLLNRNGSAAYFQGQASLFEMGGAMTAAQVANYYTAIQAFMTALETQV